MDMLETKQAKDEVIYFAVANKEHIQEIHYRQAACGNDGLIVRDYIQPQYHARYMAIAQKAAERRADDGMLKTQIRWGTRM